jgi:hypothetical protein
MWDFQGIIEEEVGFVSSWHRRGGIPGDQHRKEGIAWDSTYHWVQRINQDR